MRGRHTFFLRGTGHISLRLFTVIERLAMLGLGPFIKTRLLKDAVNDS